MPYCPNIGMSFLHVPYLQTKMHRNKWDFVNYLEKNIVYNIRKVQ
jgi:hypothetical protein